MKCRVREVYCENHSHEPVIEWTTIDTDEAGYSVASSPQCCAEEALRQVWPDDGEIVKLGRSRHVFEVEQLQSPFGRFLYEVAANVTTQVLGKALDPLALAEIEDGVADD